MGKLTLKQVRVVADAFLQYLESKNLLKPFPKPELRKIYYEFRSDIKLPYKTSYSNALYALYRINPRKAYVKYGIVVFTNKAFQSDTQNKQERSERNAIYTFLRNCKNKDDLLTSEYVKLEISADLEKKQGYVRCDLKSQALFNVKIKNISDGEICLRNCLFLKSHPYLLLNNKPSCTSSMNQDIALPANSSYNVTVSCNIEDQVSDQVGLYTGELFFRFTLSEDQQKTVVLMRYVEFFLNDEIVEFLQPTSPYKPILNTSVDDRPFSSILPGEKVEYGDSVNKLKMTRNLPHYSVSAAVRNAFKRGLFQNPRYRSYTEPNCEEETDIIELLSSDFELSNYAAKFSRLIEIEEMQTVADIRAYDLEGVALDYDSESPHSPGFYLSIPGLSEKRPSVLKGDSVYLRKVDEYYGIKYEGCVHRVERDRVLLRFHRDFDRMFTPDLRFNVRFTVSRLPIKLQHRAVKSIATSSIKHLLFPSHVGLNQDLSHHQLVAYNRKIGENPQQRSAVLSIMYGTSRLPYIIYGPPGTGKTMTVVETIKQVVLNQNKRVLICAPSNSACDLMVQRLYKKANHGGHIEKKDIYRLNAFSRHRNHIPNDIRDVCNFNPQAGVVCPSKEKLLNYKVLATTLVTAGRLSSAELGHFDFVFIDEAGHAMEPECLIAVDGLLGKDGRLVLVGDPKQLGPVVRSYAAKEYGLDTSFLERLMEDMEVYQQDEEDNYNPLLITKLLNNYRSHEDILKISNECFYDGQLKVCADPVLANQFSMWEELPKRGFPIIFHGVKGKDEKEGNSPSYFNAEEASVIHNYLKQLDEMRNNKVSGSEIGIISPYRKQVEKLRKMLEQDKKQKKSGWSYIKPKEIKIGSVEEFQGQERRVIIISTVRSNSDFLIEDEKFKLGFLNNCKRFNVAITRAIGLLIVVGNPEVLCRDYYWRSFIKHCLSNGGYRGIPFTLPDESDDKDVKVDELTKNMESLQLQSLLPDDLTSDLQSHVEPPHVDKI